MERTLQSTSEYTTRNRLPDVGQVLTAEYLDQLDRERALDGEDSLEDDEDTDSECDENNLLPD